MDRKKGRRMKSPSFNAYPNNWLGSGRISAMLPEQEGAYFRLLCYQWNSEDQTIPASDEDLAMLSRLNGRWPTMGAKVKACFNPLADDATKLRNERLWIEFCRIEALREKKSAGGKHAMANRYQSKQDKPKSLTRVLVDSYNREQGTGNREQGTEQRDREQGEGEKPLALRYSLEDCQKAAEGIGVAPDMIEAFFVHYAAVDFVDGAGRPIASLKHALQKWKAGQPSHGKTTGPAARPENPLAIKARIEAAEAEIRAMPSYAQDRTEAQRARAVELKARIKEWSKQMAGG